MEAIGGAIRGLLLLVGGFALLVVLGVAVYLYIRRIGAYRGV